MRFILCFLLVAGILLGSAAFPIASRAELSADFYLGGAIILGESTTACDSTIAGALRYNDTDKVIELCDGTEWVVLGGAG